MVRGEATSPEGAAASGQDTGPLGAALSNLTYPGRQLAWENKVTDIYCVLSTVCQDLGQILGETITLDHLSDN